MMDIIDFHAHIYPDKIAEKAVLSIGDFYNLKMKGKGTSEALLSAGEKAGITKYVVHSVAVTEKTVEAINKFIISECQTHKEFIGFMTMHNNYENKIDETEKSLKAGLKGVKIHPDTQKFNMDDENMFELYDYLQQYQIPLLIHCGDYRYDYSHPRRLKNILHKFPKLLAIGAHFGGWSVFDLALEYLKDENCYMDLSSSIAMLGVKRGKELIRKYGAERILFGSDFPMWNPELELKTFKSMELTEKENKLILCDNAKTILKIK